MSIKMLRIPTQQNFIQLKLADGKEVFAKVTPEVKSFALQNLTPGDDVDIISTNEADGLHVSKIGKVGTLGAGTTQNPLPPQQSSPSGGGGSGKQTEQTEQPNNYRQVNPDTQRLIVHQSVMSSTCTAVQGLICQLQDTSANNISEYICTIYKRLLKEVES